MNNQIKSDILLLIVTIFWGTSYVLMKMGLGDMGPFNLIAFRFIIGFLVASSIFFKKIIKTDLRTIKISIVVGTILFLVYALVAYGLNYTSASNAGFLIGLSVVIIPILQGVILKEMPKKNAMVGVLFAIVGIFLLAVKENLTMNFGDILCILCAFVCSVHIIMVEKFTKDLDSAVFGILQLGVVGVLSIISALLFEGFQLPTTKESVFAIIILSIFCTALSYVAQTIAQQYTSSTHTGIIFSLEAVFSAIFAYFFAGEILSQRGYIGAVLLILGTFIAEINFSMFFKSKGSASSYFLWKK